MAYRMAVIKYSQGTIVTLPPQLWRNLSATSSAGPCILAGSTRETRFPAPQVLSRCSRCGTMSAGSIVGRGWVKMVDDNTMELRVANRGIREA
jgi:hypothetical protein